jgi:hypothetical protein
MAQRFFDETGHYLSGGFYDYWMKDGEEHGLYTYGFPISEEYHDPGQDMTVQYFERARFEHNPDLSNNDQHVVLGLLGRELVDKLGMADSELMEYFEAATPPAEEEQEDTETTE